MNQNQWAAVDHYYNDLFVEPDSTLDAANRSCQEAGLPAYSVTPTQGKFLHLLARVHRARNILEIGTLGGYSTIWLGRALPAGGRLVTLEAEPSHAEVARDNLARAGLEDIVEVRLGPALDTLPQLDAEGCEPFDLVFIDADKANNPGYFEWALKLTRPGSLIIIDNVVRGGDVLDAESEDLSVRGIRHCNEMIAAEPRVSATTIQTVGEKGHDGFTIMLVT